MEEVSANPKGRTVSSTSSASSVTEYVNEMYAESELELSKVVSIQVTNDSVDTGENENKGSKNLKEFTDISSVEDDRFIPQGFRKMYVAALVVLIFAVCMGYTASYSATATENMEKPNSPVHPNNEEVSWIGSLMTIGALIGGMSGGYFTNLFGRKGTLILNTLPFVTGWILIAYAKSTGLIYAGRILTGVCTGIVSVATPMYLIEISTPEIRGLLGASFQLFVVIGVLIVSSLGAVLTWGWLAIAGGIITLIAAVLMILMPESPRWLMSKKRREEAKKAYIFLQGETFDAEAECQAVEEEISNQPAGNVQLKEFLSPAAYKPFILSIMLMFFQQFSGINAILFYTVIIFKGAHVSLDPVVATIIVDFVQVLATFLGSILMDRAGRKILLYISGAFMSLSLIVFGGYDFAKTKDPSIIDSLGWLPVICLTAFISAFSVGFGPTPWLMLAEMNSARFKSVVSGVSTALNWSFAFIITYTFDKLKNEMNFYGLYWLYAGFCLASVFLTYFFLPETKGKTIQDIENYFNKK